MSRNVKVTTLFVTASLLLLAACSDDDGGFDLAASKCERQAQCGMPSVECQGTPPNLTCVGYITTVDYDTCYESETILVDGLTAQQKADEGVCARWCAQQTCVDQDMVDGMADAYMGQDVTGFPALDPPPECGTMQEDWFPPCGFIAP